MLLHSKQRPSSLLVLSSRTCLVGSQPRPPSAIQDASRTCRDTRQAKPSRHIPPPARQRRQRRRRPAESGLPQGAVGSGRAGLPSPWARTSGPTSPPPALPRRVPRGPPHCAPAAPRGRPNSLQRQRDGLGLGTDLWRPPSSLLPDAAAARRTSRVTSVSAPLCVTEDPAVGTLLGSCVPRRNLL